MGIFLTDGLRIITPLDTHTVTDHQAEIFSDFTEFVCNKSYNSSIKLFSYYSAL